MSVNCSVLFLTKVKKLLWFHRSSVLLAGVKLIRAPRALDVLGVAEDATAGSSVRLGENATCC